MRLRTLWFAAAAAVGLATQGCHLPNLLRDSRQDAASAPTPDDGGTRLRVFRRVCEDSIDVGQVIAARVLNVDLPGGLFAQIALRAIDGARGEFHFDVVRLLDLTYSMPVTSYSGAVSRAADVERGPELCLRPNATLVASIDADLSRFEAGWRAARRREILGVREYDQAATMIKRRP